MLVIKIVGRAVGAIAHVREAKFGLASTMFSQGIKASAILLAPTYSEALNINHMHFHAHGGSHIRFFESCSNRARCSSHAFP